jgi:serine/threonine protein kinase
MENETTGNKADLFGSRYLIKRELGRGAMGVVSLAHDARTDRMVAIKVIAKGMESDNFKGRFFREMKVAAKLSHPNILPVLDFGEADQKLYYITPYIEGDSLEGVLNKKSNLSVYEALAVAIAISSALDIAHRSGFIHRDIKPSNVIIPLVSGAYQYDQALLMDFGVTGVLEKETNVTQAGEIFGTPLYMSPEQLKGASQSAASDYYGLGVLLFRMIFGHLPFQGNNLAAIMFQIVSEPVKIPNHVRLPQDLSDFIADCLEKDERKRPTNPYQTLIKIQASLVSSANDKAISGDFSHDSTDSATARAPVEFPSIKPSPIPMDDSAADHYMPQESKAGYPLFWILFGLSLLLGIVGSLVFLFNRGTLQTEIIYGTLTGLVLAVSGVLLGRWVRSWILSRKNHLEEGAAQLLYGAKNRVDLSQSLAIEVNEIIRRCQGVDERFLGKTLAIMVGNFEQAEKLEDKQKALVYAVDILEKLMKKLSPWYVRKEKLIALVISSIGIVLGVIKIYETISNL